MDCDELAEAVRRVVRRCQRMGLSLAEAEDCVQNSLLAWLARHPHHLDGTTGAGSSGGAGSVRQVEAWLTVAARRSLIDRYRRTRREQNALARLRAAAPPPVDPSELVTDQALAAWLVAALPGLPATTEQVCRSIGAGAAADQTAARLGLSRRAVDSHLTRARRRLRHLAAGAVAALAATAHRLAHHTTPVTATTLAATAAVTVAVLPQPIPLPPVTSPAPPAAAAPNRHPHPQPTSRPNATPAFASTPGQQPPTHTSHGDAPVTGAPAIAPSATIAPPAASSTTRTLAATPSPQVMTAPAARPPSATIPTNPPAIDPDTIVAAPAPSTPDIGIPVPPLTSAPPSVPDGPNG